MLAARREPPAFLVWVRRIVTDSMAILVVAAGAYATVGDRADAIVLGIALLPIILVGVVLEGRADAALARLRDLTASADSSTATRPSTTPPSAATISPSRTTSKSPGTTASAAISISAPSRTTRARWHIVNIHRRRWEVRDCHSISEPGQ